MEKQRINNKKISEQKNDELHAEQIIALMDVYLSEWQHRDNMLWSQSFKLFYADLIVIVLPNITEFIGVVLPEINKKFFPIIGIFIAIIFLYIGIGYSMRLQASSKTYEKIMNNLSDEKYRRVSIRDKNEIKFGWFFSLPLSYFLVIVMFVILICISIVLLIA